VQYADIISSISGLIFTGMLLVFGLFVNLVFGKSSGSVLGTSIPFEYVRIALGPVIVITNAALFLFLGALSRLHLTAAEISYAQSYQVWWILGPLFNPFYVSNYPVINAVGYAFLIILWWIGVYTFLYSVDINADSPFYDSWKLMVSAIYLCLGLMSMVAIQRCWMRFGFGAYTLKWKFALVGIVAGMTLPPLLSGRGIPRIF
jgi:hypothetical protein